MSTVDYISHVSLTDGQAGCAIGISRAPSRRPTLSMAGRQQSTSQTAPAPGGLHRCLGAQNQGARDCVDQTSARSGEARRTPRPKGSPNRVPILSRRHPKAEPRGVGRSHRTDTATTLLRPCNDTQRRPNRRRAGSLARRPSPKHQPLPNDRRTQAFTLSGGGLFAFPGDFFGA